MAVYVILALALALDAVFGEPQWLWRRLPHPVELMGKAINWFDSNFNNHTRSRGAVTIALLVIIMLAVGFGIKKLPDYGVFELLLAAILIAQRSLSDHVSAVADALDRGLENGKTSVGFIVGRDTSNMDETAVARAAIESAAENFSDGMIAPAFWFLLFGLPGILVYKMVNTADSMIGHKSETYLNFGWATAKLDDILNLVPARISALLICLTTGSRNAWKIVRQDARHHRSPNAGWPESAMAGALDISLAGPRSYGGKLGDDLFVNQNGRRNLSPDDIRAAVSVLWQAWVIFGLIVVVLAIIF